MKENLRMEMSDKNFDKEGLPVEEVVGIIKRGRGG